MTHTNENYWPLEPRRRAYMSPACPVCHQYHYQIHPPCFEEQQRRLTPEGRALNEELLKSLEEYSVTAGDYLVFEIGLNEELLKLLEEYSASR